MRIAINTIFIKKGGGVTALDKLLSEFVRRHPEHDYHVIVSDALPPLACLEHPSVRRYRFRLVERSYLLASLWYLLALPMWLLYRRIDVLLSMTLYLPPVSAVPAVMLLQDAKFFEDSPELWRRFSRKERWGFGLRKLWVYRSVGLAQTVMLQSRTFAAAVIARLPRLAPRLRVVHHGPGFLDGPQAAAMKCPLPGEQMRVACISLFRPYKNFEVLMPALRRLRDSGVPAEVHLTLDSQYEPAVRALLNEAARFGVADMVVNHGELGRAELAALYRSSHLFVFPSVCESFGFPQVEAMAFGLPVIAADTAVNRELCGEAASYFPADDSERLAELIESHYRAPAQAQRASAASARKAAEFSWELAAEATLGDLVATATGDESRRRAAHYSVAVADAMEE